MGVIEEFTSSKRLGDCFKEAVKKKIRGRLRALIVPHAGYIYSGKVAAAGFRLMKKGDYDRVVVIGFYHGRGEEHSVKVQIPLIEYILGKGVVIEENYVEGMKEWRIGDRDLVVASSDLSHYEPIEKAERMDKKTIEAILSLDEDRIRKEAKACGLWPILNLNSLAKKKGWRAELIDYRTSAEASGERESVVGYAAIAYWE